MSHTASRSKRQELAGGFGTPVSMNWRDAWRGGAPRQVACGAGSYWGGRRFAPTALRCSVAGRGAELATRPCGALRSNNCAEPDVEARVSFGTRAAPRPALLAAPEIARAAGHLPRRDTSCCIGGWNTQQPSYQRAASSAGSTTAVTRKGACGPGAARLVERREAQGGRPRACRRTRALQHLTHRSCLSVAPRRGAQRVLRWAGCASIAGQSAPADRST
jgi:hypothetical protein